MTVRWVIGIDEAGRGPLAGPVAVAAVALPAGRLPVSWDIKKIKDSKHLSARRREVWRQLIVQARVDKKLKYAVSLVGNLIIDRLGIVRAVRLGIRRCLRRLGLPPTDCRVLLDGNLRAPRFYRDQQTIIRGDETVPIIALASVIAKVRRDRFMNRQALTHPQYNFPKHKGYGTTEHYRLIRQHGLSLLHRRSFLQN